MAGTQRNTVMRCFSMASMTARGSKAGSTTWVVPRLNPDRTNRTSSAQWYIGATWRFRSKVFIPSADTEIPTHSIRW